MITQTVNPQHNQSMLTNLQAAPGKWLKACYKIDTYLGAKWCHGGHQRQQRSL